MEKKNILKLNHNLWKEILISFTKIKKLSDNFIQEKFNDKSKSLSKLFHEIYQGNEINNLIDRFEQSLVEANINPDITKSSSKVLKFLINELHKEDIKINNNNNLYNKIDIFEDENSAYDYFLEKNANNKSFIQENFFGIKKTKKICDNCKKISFVFNYVNCIPLNISSINEFVRLKPLYDTVYRTFEKKLFCPFCKSENKFVIQMEMKSLPNYLIIILYNHQKNVKIKFLNEEFLKGYKLISFVIKEENGYKLANLLKCQSDINKEYKAYWVEKGKYFAMDEDGKKEFNENDINENPYFIIYKKKKKNHGNDEDSYTNGKKYSEMSDVRLLKRHRSNKSKTEKIDKKIKSSKIEYSKENEKENQNEKKEKSLIKIDSSIKSSTGGERIIRLYFKLQDEIITETYFIDIENTVTFETILDKLKESFGLSDLENIKLMYSGKELKKNDTPQDLDIPHGANIFILPQN